MVARRKASPQFVHLIMWAGLVVLFFLFLRAIRPILLPFVIGMLMAYLFDPIADRLERRGFSRGLAAALITLGFFSILVAIVVWVGPMLYAQLAELIGKLPAFLQDVEGVVREQTTPFFHAVDRLTGGNTPEDLPKSPSEMMQRAINMGGDLASRVVESSFAVINVVSLLLITPIVSFYCLRDWDRMVAKLDTLLPRAYAPTIRTQAKLVSTTLAAYLRGQLYVMGLLAIYYVIALTALGLHYSLLLGVLAGTLVIIPYLGTWTATTLTLSVAYGQFGLGSGSIRCSGWCSAVFGIGQLLEVQILTPRVIGERIGLHPLWLLFGMLAGAVLIGFVGVLLAEPITAIIAVGVRFLVGLYLDSSLYKDA
ncbi:MAG: AI-2E family transporter [Alphaproteobacteria bacterium]